MHTSRLVFGSANMTAHGEAQVFELVLTEKAPYVISCRPKHHPVTHYHMCLLGLHEVTTPSLGKLQEKV